MVIDENDEQSSIIEEKSIPPTNKLTTLNSLVEKEISKTLSGTDKRSIHSSPDRTISNNNNYSISTSVPAPPPPLVNLNKSHNQQFVNKGSIMRGTPISSSAKPMSIDPSPSPHSHSHHYNNHPSSRNDYSHLKSPKMLDRNLEQQQHLLQQQQQQQQQHSAYMRHFNPQQQYLQPKSSTNKSDMPSADRFETLKTDFATSKYLTATHSPNHEQ